MKWRWYLSIAAVRQLVVPPLLQQRLWGEKERYETRVIKGYTLKDAKKRAGIQ